jgi:hypothetical protein
VDLRISSLEDNERIGVVYTPSFWSSWAINHFGVVESWVSGKSVIDPTVGDGSFIQALVEETLRSGSEITSEMIENLYGFDLRSEGIESLKQALKENYGIELSSSNLRKFDAVLEPFPQKFDVIIGNPPWANFTQLPEEYKEILKPKYQEYGLLSNTHSTLLGNSRVDIAALVVSRLMEDALADDGVLLMFLPTSLFDGVAHEPFRNFKAKSVQYYLNSVFDFGNQGIFGDGVNHGTNFAFAKFSFLPSDTSTVPEFVLTKDSWQSQNKRSLPSVPSDHSIRQVGLVPVSKDSKPRQGLNTCGANGVFFGDLVSGSLRDRVVGFRNLDGESFEIESSIVFPLLMRDNLTKGIKSPLRFVLLPYNPKTAKPLTKEEIQDLPLAEKYFTNKVPRLLTRRGTLIQSGMSKTSPWCLLGVGPYSFAPFKLLWLTAGQSTFDAHVISSSDSKPWQANQSLQAFMAFQTAGDALTMKDALTQTLGVVGLRSLGTPKSLSWAQPGRVSRLLSVAK